MKTKVSQKAILPNLEKISALVDSLGTEIENMPECSRKKSLQVTMIALRKKSAIRESSRGMLSDEKVLEYLEAHPELKEQISAGKTTSEKKKKRL